MLLEAANYQISREVLKKVLKSPEFVGESS